MAGRRPKHTDQQVLSLFAGGPPVRFTDEIAEQLDMSSQGAYKRLTKLQQRGLIEKHTTGQAAVWWPTAEGRALIE